jgi:dipeptidyl aminopeptidase/acylaminoacyl peptidase
MLVTLAAVLLALPLSTVAGQVASPAQGQAPGSPQAAPPASAKPADTPAKPKSWADEILSQEHYVAPPPELATAVLAPRYQNVTLANASRDKAWFLDEIGDGPVPMKVFSKPFHELGGVFVDAKANRARALSIRNNVGIQAISAADGTKKIVQVPPNARVSNATWSPDGKHIAYFVHSDDATHIWLTDVATNQPRQVTRTPVLATLVSTFEFTEDSKTIATVVVPDGRGPAPAAPTAPTGPSVRLSETADKNRLRTFPSLMSTPYEFELLEWHATGQLVLIDLSTPPAKNARARAAGAGVTKIGQPAMFRALDLSPDGAFVRVTRVTRPFSYIVPVSNFGSVDEIWDTQGKMLAKVSERPLNLGVQDDTAPPPDPQPAAGGRGGGAAQQGKRELAWRQDGQGITYLEQEPAPPAAAADAATAGRAAAARGAARATGTGGDQAGSGRGQGPVRKDRLYQWLPPFDDKGAKVLFESNARMSNLRYSPDHQTIFFSERVGQDTIEYAVALSEPAKRYTLARYRADDVYANPGSVVLTRGGGGGGARGGGAGARGGGAGGGGTVQLSADGQSVFFQGTVYDKNPQETAPKTFIDKVAIKTGEKKRLFESDNRDVFERPTTLIDAEAGRFVLARESPTEVLQYFMVDGSTQRQLTRNEDVAPDITGAPRERLTVERADGFRFRVTVTLPPGYQKGTRLPAIFWFYPREFSTQEDYDRPDRTFNKNTFPTFGARSMHYFIRLGYAVVEPDAPIVGPTGQMNNNYEHDLRNNLAATIDELDRRALVDRTRLAIGGHSYGAFSAVNAMVHTPFFKAGIAGDGAYNRTLTPIGFQSERRDIWEARDVYLSMSPFLYANNLTGALLMYHGLADQNVGTDPTNSIRLYHALNGLGKTTALYLYPLEDHGPAAKETLLDLWARWAAWLDKYVKNPQKPEKKAAAPDTPGRH